MSNRIRKLLGMCVHDWNKWNFVVESWVEHSLIAPNYENRFIKQAQTRTCKKCGLYEKKYIR